MEEFFRSIAHPHDDFYLASS
jgi:hypothetical protein